MFSGGDHDCEQYPETISEVGSEHINENHTENTLRCEKNGGNEDNWKLLFEMQNSNMKALIEALSKPQRSSQYVNLPEFDPDKNDADARSWCATSDLCFADNPMEGGQLIVTISKALKGTASTWLSSITYPGMTWSEFKELFTARFVSTETSAGTLIKLNSDKPKEGETWAAYGSRIMSLLFNRWKNLTVEQIVVATTVAHLSQFDSKLQRMAFTSEINNRQRLQQELQAFTYLKRKSSTVPDQQTFEPKRMKISQILSIKCFHCGKVGHRLADCLHRKHAKEIRRSRTTFKPLDPAFSGQLLVPAPLSATNVENKDTSPPDVLMETAAQKNHTVYIPTDR